MSDRPFFDASVGSLEQLFDERGHDRAFLKALLEELGQRTMPRASRLRGRVTEALLSLPVEEEVADRTPESRAQPKNETSNESVTSLAEDENGPFTLDGASYSEDDSSLDDAAWSAGNDEIPGHSEAGAKNAPFENRATAILDTWIALEVLSPRTFNSPEDLVERDRSRIARFDERGLPWERGERARPRTRLYYQVVLGAVRLDRATQSLLKVFRDGRVDRPKSKALAALAIVTVDKAGCPVGDTGIAVSSFGWGFRRAVEGAFRQLGQWTTSEPELVRALANRLIVTDDDDEILPLSRSRIDAATQWLAQAFSLPDDHLDPSCFAIRSYQWVGIRQPPEPVLLNSFFLRDLARARRLVVAGQAGVALRRYLGIDLPKQRVDLERDSSSLMDTLDPRLIPAGRWPSGKDSLVILQQAAVGIARTELADAGIAGVNGPPGTGKTTLLRDVVASIVVDRAKALASFDDPEQAFEHRAQMRQGSSWTHLYELAPAIRGHEIVVASSNNKAVENVSKELPSFDAIANDPPPPRYFRTTADALAGQDATCWGAAAAILGKAANRSVFYRSFWQDEDVGLRSYLWAAAGGNPVVVRTDPKTGVSIQATPRVVSEERPPTCREEALQRWKKARARFRKALGASEDALMVLAKGREAYSCLSCLRAGAEQASSDLATATAAHRTSIENWNRQERQAEALAIEWRARQSELSQHKRMRPGFLARLFGTRRWKAWSERRPKLLGSVSTAREYAEKAKLQAEDLASIAADASVLLREAAMRDEKAKEPLAEAEDAIAQARRLAGDRFVDTAFQSRDRTSLQRSTAWSSREVQRLRDLVFVAAFDLHRAFIDAAAKPIRQNLRAILGVLIGQGLDDSKKPLLPSLWSTLFLMTPVVSTTFASVERMLGPLPKEALGWLLIDEAGQALPQAAVGSLIRSQRALVVGDPLQLEPIVALPLTLVQEIAKAFKVDPDDWTAPRVSAQSCADQASRYFTEFQRRDDQVRIGAPLIVHRRCVEPMFSISNQVAYGGIMVPAAEQRSSRIRDLLGPTRWIEVEGLPEEKWCPEEGDTVVQIMRALADARVVEPDLFIITPFVVVARRLLDCLLRHEQALAPIIDDLRTWGRQRIGTVHTVQGKEAEAVIFVLGAPDARQVGARNWAGWPPNLLNVAVTRSKQVLYVIGNRRLWSAAGCFADLSRRIP